MVLIFPIIFIDNKTRLKLWVIFKKILKYYCAYAILKPKGNFKKRLNLREKKYINSKIIFTLCPF